MKPLQPCFFFPAMHKLINNHYRDQRNQKVFKLILLQRTTSHLDDYEPFSERTTHWLVCKWVTMNVEVVHSLSCKSWLHLFKGFTFSGGRYKLLSCLLRIWSKNLDKVKTTHQLPRSVTEHLRIQEPNIQTVRHSVWMLFFFFYF